MLATNNKKEEARLLKKILYNLFIVIISVGVLYFALVAIAGSLTPPGAVAPTMMSLEDIYNALAGTYDSSAITPDNNGNAMQILKCITVKIDGGSCP